MHAPSSSATADGSRRGQRLLWLSPTWLGGGLLFACMFLPLVEGCQHDIRPYELLLGGSSSVAEFLDAVWLTSPYFYGGLTAVGVLVAAILGDWRFYKWWWRGYLIAAGVLSLAYWAAVGAELRSGENDMAESLLARWYTLTASVLSPLALWLSYRNGRTWVVKTAFLQLAFALFCLTWFLYFGVSTEWNVKYGFYLSLAAVVLLVSGAVIQWRRRFELQRSREPATARQTREAGQATSAMQTTSDVRN